MKKGIATASIIISMFILGVFLTPKHSEASFWDHVSIHFGVGVSNSYGSYSNYGGYGYGNNYGSNNYGYPAVYGYGNNYYTNADPIYPRYGAYNTGYNSMYGNYGGYGYGGGYPSTYPVCMTYPC